jgi:hypothetical protein
VQDRYDDAIALFYQDVPPELAAQALNRARIQSEARMGEPSPLRAWPDTTAPGTRTLAKTVWAPSPEASPLVAAVPEP